MKKLILLFLVLFTVDLSLADEDEYEGYDSIVGQLSSTRSQLSKQPTYNDPFDQVLLHTGVGMALSMTNFQLGSKNRTGFFQGVELNFGIDLFSENWTALGAYRNLGRATIDNRESQDIAELNEFDLMLVHRPRINRFMRFRTAGGLSARYLTYYDNLNNQQLNYKTPAWTLNIGLESILTKVFTFTADVSYRSALINETIDNSAFGASLRVDANF